VNWGNPLVKAWRHLLGLRQDGHRDQWLDLVMTTTLGKRITQTPSDESTTTNAVQGKEQGDELLKLPPDSRLQT
jgi:hypothetical protein